MARTPSLDLAVIGNGALAALVDRDGRMVWLCWPQPDGDPIFSALIDGVRERGLFAILPNEDFTCRQSYVADTAILRTVVTTGSGAYAVTDFAPLFSDAGAADRPAMLVRRIEPLSGSCRVRVTLKPTRDYGAGAPTATEGADCVRFDEGYRVTTDAPLDGEAFVLAGPLTFVLHADEALADFAELSRGYEERTRAHWLGWVAALALPAGWRDATVRAAITLRLCCFPETGGVVAALTTSIPEAPGSERTWDYRFCWIRDAHFTVETLNRLGASRPLELFVAWLDVALALEGAPRLQPLYGLRPDADLTERFVPTLEGYRGHGPVRVGNAAALQTQQDVYGDILLAAAPLFLDPRLAGKGDVALFERLEPLAEKALDQALSPDAGIWEFRGRARVHTYSAAMCWVACDRVARIAAALGLSRAQSWRARADGLRQTILARAWNETVGAFCGSLDGDECDASVLLLQELGFVAADDPRFVATVEHVGRRLSRGGMLLRYDEPDDFGTPEVAFVVCTFWYVDALAAIGRGEDARAIYETLLARRNAAGLLSEDIHPATGELWGNFPQTYSLCGIVNSALRLSRAGFTPAPRDPSRSAP